MAHVGISVYDPSTSKYIYNYQGDKFFVPASNVKIPTCYVAMKYLGDSLAGLKYERTPSSMLILPTGDPSFYHPDFKNQPVIDFLKADTSKVIVWSDHLFKAAKYGNGWSWNDYDAAYMPERSPFPIHGNVVAIRDTAHTVPRIFINRATYAGAYQNGYRIERTDDGIFNAVESKTKFNGDEIPFVTGQSITNRLLKEILGKEQVFASEPLIKAADPRRIIYSHPTDSLLKPMMHRSDNFFAEQSLLMVSNQLLGEMNDARVIDSVLRTDFKDLPQPPRWADGSGLSRYNLFTPQDLVYILNKMKEEFGMERIKEIFPTGNEGTLRNYYTTEEGYIYAKTGTLSGVVAISGFLYTKENKLLVFSVLVNNHRSSATDVRRAVEKFIKELRENG